MKKIEGCIFLVMLCCALSSCSKDEDYPLNKYSKIIGTWQIDAYLTSGGYFISVNDSSYYKFTQEKTYEYYSGRVTKIFETGSLKFDEIGNSVSCDLGKGWHEDVRFNFITDNYAELHTGGNLGGQVTYRSK